VGGHGAGFGAQFGGRNNGQTNSNNDDVIDGEAWERKDLEG
jgi:N-methylhydantoinase B/oxoprolinase/acetone carboxylase alpha subunit